MVTDPPKKYAPGTVVADPFGDGEPPRYEPGSIVADPFGDGGDEIVAPQEDAAGDQLAVIGNDPVRPQTGAAPMDDQRYIWRPEDQQLPPAPVANPTNLQGTAIDNSASLAAEAAKTAELDRIKHVANTSRRLLTNDNPEKYRFAKSEAGVPFSDEQGEDILIMQNDAATLAKNESARVPNLRRGIEDEFWQYADAVSAEGRPTQFSRARMEAMKAAENWDDAKQADLDGAILLHQRDVLDGREVQVLEALRDGVSLEDLKDEMLDISAGRRFMKEQWAEYQKRDPKSFHDKYVEMKQRETDAAGQSYVTDMLQAADAGLKGVGGSVLAGLYSVASYPFTADKEYDSANRFSELVAEAAKEADADVSSGRQGPIFSRNPDTGELRFDKSKIGVGVTRVIGGLVPYLASGAAGGAPGVIATSFTSGYNDYVTEAMKAGARPESVEGPPAMMFATLYSAAEMINPQLFFANKAGMTSAFIKAINSGATLKEAGKAFWHGGTREATEEFMQTQSKLVTNAMVNELSGEKLDTKRTVEGTAEELFLGFLVGGLADVGGTGALRANAMKRKSVQWAAENPFDAKAIIARMPADQQEAMTEKLDKLTSAFEANRLSGSEGVATADAIVQRDNIVTDTKKKPADPAIVAAQGDPRTRQVINLTAEIARRRGLTEDETALAMASMGYLTLPEGASIKKNPDGSVSLKVKEAKEGEQGMTEAQVLEDLRSQLPPVAAPGVPGSGSAVTLEATPLIEPTEEEKQQDILNGNTSTFTYDSREEVPEIFRDRITSEGETNGKKSVRVTMSKREADFLLSKNAPPTAPTTPSIAAIDEELGIAPPASKGSDILGAEIGPGARMDPIAKAVRNAIIKVAGRMSDARAMKLAKALVPDLKVVRHKTKESLTAAHPDKATNVDGFWDPVKKVIHVGPNGNPTHIIAHELMHPVLEAFIGTDTTKIGTLYDELIKRPGGKAFAEFGKRYLNKENALEADGQLLAKEEAIVDFLGAVADGKFDKELLDNRFVQWLKDLLNAIREKLGIDTSVDISDVQTLKDLAKAVAEASRRGKAIKFTEKDASPSDVVRESRSEPSNAAKLFQENGMNAQQAEEYMRSRDVDEEVIKSVVAELETRKTAEQSAAERLASGEQRINAPDNPVSEQVTAEAKSRGAKGDGMVTVNERTALRDRLKDLAKATKEAFKKGTAEGTLAGEMHGKAAGRKEGSKESETHAGRARKVMTDAVKIAIDPIKGKLTPGQSRSLASAVAKTDPTSITQINKLLDKIDSIVADSNYSDKLLDFKKLRAKIISAAKTKNGQSARLAEQFAKLDAEQADIDAHISLGETILKALRVVDKDGATQPIDNGKLLDYINAQLDVQAKQKARDDHDELVDYAISIGGMDIPLDKIKEIRDQIDEAYAPVMKEIRRIAEEKSIDELRAAAAKAQQDLKAHHPKNKEEAEVLVNLSKMDLSKLSKDQLKELIFTAGNIVRNNDYAGARDFASKTPSQQAILEMGNEAVRLGRPGSENKLLSSLDTVAVLFEKIFRNPERAAKYRRLIGLDGAMNAISDAHHRTEQKQARRNELAKKLKVDDSVLNRYRMGVYAYLIQNYGGSPEQQQADFDIAAQNLRESINNLGDPKTEERHREHQRFYEQAVNEVLGEAKTLADLKLAPPLKALVENEIRESADVKDMHDRAATMDHAVSPRAVSNYTARRNKKLFANATDQRKLGELFEPSNAAQSINPDPASAKLERVPKLPAGSAVDLDFYDVVDDSYQQNMEDTLGARHVNVMREVFKSGVLDELMGPDTAKLLKDRIHNILNSEDLARTGLGIPPKLWRRFGRMSARLALAGFIQFPKQLTVGISTIAALGKDFALLPESYGDAVSAMMDKDSWQNKLMEGEQIHERGRVLGGIEKIGDAITQHAILDGDEKTAARYRKLVTHKAGVWTDRVGYMALKAGDVLSAQAAWMAYYKQKIREKGVDLNDPSWHTNKDPEAAAYANQMVERSQNANTIQGMPEIYKEKGGTKYVLDMLFAFSSFALNMNKRMARDFKMIGSGPKEDKIFAARDLTGVALEALLFSMTSVAAAELGKMWAAWAIGALTGDDPEKDKKARGYWEKVIARSVWDVVFGAMPEVFAHYPKKAINQMTHDKDKRDLFYVSSDANLGLFGPLGEQMGYVIDGVYYAIDKEKPEDKQLATAMAIVALSQMILFSDQTITIPLTREASRKLNKKEKKAHSLFPAP